MECKILLEIGVSKEVIQVTKETLETIIKSKLGAAGCEGAYLCPFDSGSAKNMYILQRWSTQWNAFIDFSKDDNLEDGDKFKVSEYKVYENANKVKSLCETLARPSEANARALASLFPATKRKKFDPLCRSANFDSQQKKKAFSSKGRAKSVTVVCLDYNSSIIPKSSMREKLRSDGLVKDMPIFRYLTHEEVKGCIEQEFSLLSGFTFLKAYKNDLLRAAETQELYGAEVINLAGKGALYIKAKSDKSLTTKSTSVNSLCASPTSSYLPSHSSPNASHSLLRDLLTSKDSSFSLPSLITSSQSSSPCTSSTLLQRADKVLEKLKTPVEDLGLSSDYPVTLSSDSEFMDEDKNDDCDLLEWRQIREEQDCAYQESLRIDHAKEAEKLKLMDEQCEKEEKKIKRFQRLMEL